MPDISAVKRALRDQYGCRTVGSNKNDPILVDVVDSVYHLVIAGVLYRASIMGGKISSCRRSKEKHPL